jgi:chitinase
MYGQDFAAKYWVQNGCPKEKLIIGLPTYGKCFRLRNSNINGVEAPASGPCNAGAWTREAGFLSYYEASL